MKTFKFYKTTENRWFVDLPTWEGDIDDLEMVCGADTMLDIIAQGENEINVSFSDKPFDCDFILTYKNDELGGAMYKLTHDLYSFNVWLCHVTKFVFNYFPPTIYIK